MRKALILMLSAAVLLAAMIPGSEASSAPPMLTAYSVPGSPFRIAVEAPGHIWFTLPAQNAIGNLVVASSGAYEVNVYQIPTADGQPYDIAYSADAVWVTERTGNKIARFEPLTHQWTEYTIPTADSQPTGLIALAGQPVQIWFVERAGNKLGRCTVDDALTGVFDEFPLPAGSQFADAEMEDVAATSSNAVWFTLPGVGLIGRFNLSLWGTPQAFDFLNPRNYPWLYPGKILRPWQIKLDGRGLPWFTEPGTNQLIRYIPNTTASFQPYPLPTSDSGPDGLDVTQINATTDELVVWYTAHSANRVGRLHKLGYDSSIGELVLPGSTPTDIAVDTDSCVWIAAGGTSRVMRWCAPYFQRIYLPLTLKG